MDIEYAKQVLDYDINHFTDNLIIYDVDIAAIKTILKENERLNKEIGHIKLSKERGKNMTGRELFKNLGFTPHYENWGHSGATVYEKIDEDSVKTEVIFYIHDNNIAVSEECLNDPLAIEESLIFIEKDLLKAINRQVEDMNDERI